MDYTGTIIRQGGPEIEEMIARVHKHSDFHSAHEALTFWFRNLSVLENESYLDTFRTEDEICMQLLDLCEKEHALKDSHEELHHLNQQFWRNGPVYDDAAAFFESCSIPIFVITNNAAAYVSENLTKRGIHPEGIISAEEVQAYKPHREIFLRALERAGVTAEEAIHIGDSYESDVIGAGVLGIDAVLVNRKEKPHPAQQNCMTVTALTRLTG